MKNKKPYMYKHYKSANHGNTTKCTRKRGTSAEPDYIVVHNTGTSASALNNCIYFNREGASTNASADFFIDKDGKIYQYNAMQKAYSWHCGDGHGKYGITNKNSVGIEVVSAEVEFTKAQVSSLKSLVKWLMEFFDIDAEHVVRHYDASRKKCPAAYIDGEKWKVLHKSITA